VAAWGTALLKRVNRYVLFTFLALVSLLFLGALFSPSVVDCVITPLCIEAWFSMVYYDRQEVPPGPGHELHLINRFRSQRNFYINLFALLLFVIIFRVRQLVSSLARVKIELDASKAKSQ